jgi:hypothetical protein
MPLATVADVVWDRLGACLVDVERIASMQPGVDRPDAERCWSSHATRLTSRPPEAAEAAMAQPTRCVRRASS